MLDAKEIIFERDIDWLNLKDEYDAVLDVALIKRRTRRFQFNSITEINSRYGRRKDETDRLSQSSVVSQSLEH